VPTGVHATLDANINHNPHLAHRGIAVSPNHPGRKTLATYWRRTAARAPRRGRTRARPNSYWCQSLYPDRCTSASWFALPTIQNHVDMCRLERRPSQCSRADQARDIGTPPRRTRPARRSRPPVSTATKNACAQMRGSAQKATSSNRVTSLAPLHGARIRAPHAHLRLQPEPRCDQHHHVRQPLAATAPPRALLPSLRV
jgi:hypothetical protein